ncbi:MAG: hypothetical protein ACTH5F_04890, partial [Pseudolactococcus laudensis]
GAIRYASASDSAYFCVSFDRSSDSGLVYQKNTKSVLFCQNNTKMVKKSPISYQIGILLAKQYEIGKNCADFE